jgi:hypothetical protein
MLQDLALELIIVEEVAEIPKVKRLDVTTIRK